MYLQYVSTEPVFDSVERVALVFTPSPHTAYASRDAPV